MQKPRDKELKEGKTMTLLVNGERIEDWQIQQEFERLRPDYEKVFKDQSPKQQKTQLLDWSKENVIEMVLLRQEAQKRGNDIPKSEIDSALAQVKEEYKSQGQSAKELSAEDEKKLKDSIELQMKVEKTLRDICKDLPSPSQEDISEFYEENKEHLKSAEQVRVAHIVKHISWQSDEASAHELMRKAGDELKNGAIFEALVEKYSDCPDNNGDLGYITKGQMVEEFEDVVFNLGVGEVSDVFRTRFGFHIAKLYDRKPAVVYELEEVTERIVNQLKEQRRREAIDNFVDKLKDKAKIEEI